MFDTQAHTRDSGFHTTCNSSLPSSGERNVQKNTHLVGLNLCNQILEGRETTQPHNRFGLLHSQAPDLGRRASTQYDLLPSQEVLELGIVRGLPVEGQWVS